jgi:hypothetical protein
MFDKADQSDRTPIPNVKPESCYCSALPTLDTQHFGEQALTDRECVIVTAVMFRLRYPAEAQRHA